MEDTDLLINAERCLRALLFTFSWQPHVDSIGFRNNRVCINLHSNPYRGRERKETGKVKLKLLNVSFEEN